jgi:hypothetical protein
MSEILQNSNANKDDQQNSSAQTRRTQNGEGAGCAQAGRTEGKSSG